VGSVSGYVLLSIGVVTAWSSTSPVHGQGRRPGPGFLPFGLAIILIALHLPDRQELEKRRAIRSLLAREGMGPAGVGDGYFSSLCPSSTPFGLCFHHLLLLDHLDVGHRADPLAMILPISSESPPFFIYLLFLSGSPPAAASWADDKGQKNGRILGMFQAWPAVLTSPSP